MYKFTMFLPLVSALLMEGAGFLETGKCVPTNTALTSKKPFYWSKLFKWTETHCCQKHPILAYCVWTAAVVAHTIYEEVCMRPCRWRGCRIWHMYFNAGVGFCCILYVWSLSSWAVITLPFVLKPADSDISYGHFAFFGWKSCTFVAIELHVWNVL